MQVKTNELNLVQAIVKCKHLKNKNVNKQKHL